MKEETKQLGMKLCCLIVNLYSLHLNSDLLHFDAQVLKDLHSIQAEDKAKPEYLCHPPLVCISEFASQCF